MTSPGDQRAQSLAPQQAWFLGVMALVVIGMFAFVVLPYVDRPPALSGQQVTFDLPVMGARPQERLASSDLHGRPVVLDFWASWCAPCKAQAVEVGKLQAALGDQVHVVGVATSDEARAAEAYVRAHSPSYVNVFDEGSALARSLQVTALPTLVVLDAQGTVRSITGHPLSAEELSEKVAGLVP